MGDEFNIEIGHNKRIEIARSPEKQKSWTYISACQG
jgi:hypothetical protein